ncbi:DNA-3-methyladenine glycosylase 2 family protein [Calidifontibacter sp. DB0510]|uniref:DNA-3-methyladenine glycosylase II n=1 Tax=Metallococcus carri TaxID=1656884 RepID=A0A967AYG9_9MICO|nr:DNA-3-methyladenine glycosylase 2 family protein [Metallococcus carri]NHN55356.1 DNA-3-methyladenine glycosylase 2 family protein [Metallococcus carri]NOP36433.1 DNA-3-methyladenine glycosylase 2 family protein [Calidifontibacter sp. DB2511S]
MNRTGTVRLAFTPPLLPDNLFGHLVATGVPGVEEWRAGAYRRTVRLAHGPAIVALRPGAEHVELSYAIHPSDDLDELIAVCRFLLDLDADPGPIDTRLAQDPLLAPLIAAAPGRRVPRTVDPAELLVRLVLGQQISTKAARTHAARLVHAAGDRVEDPGGGLTQLWPRPEAIAAVADEALAMPVRRRATVRAVATALADGGLLDGALAQVRARVLALPGIGPWTVENLAMRGLGDADAFPATDLGVAAALRQLHRTARDAERWRPYRAYAVQHLWALGDHEVNDLPGPHEA